MRVLRENSLSLFLTLLFALAFTAQALTGWRAFDQERRWHHEPEIGLWSYIHSYDFASATFENWESEFLQMGLLVILTVFLRQRGSAESKKLEETEPEDTDPRDHANDPKAPWPVQKGGWVLQLYSHSLSIALFGLFGLSFVLHLMASAGKASEEAVRHGAEATSPWATLGDPSFWFESFQNWQSEFLSMIAMVVLTIYLREYGSAESKPVAAAHEETGR